MQSLSILTQFTPLVVWLQPLDDFGVALGEPKQAIDYLSLEHAQITDEIEDAPVVGEWGAKLEGVWRVESRRYCAQMSPPHCVSRQLVLGVRPA